MKDRVRVKEGMSHTLDKKGGQHHYLSYHQEYQNEYYIDFKEFQVYLGKKARAYKVWYAMASKGFAEWRNLLAATIQRASEIKAELNA